MSQKQHFNFQYEVVAEFVRAHPQGVTIRDVAEHFDCTKATAREHLERARRDDLIARTWTLASRNSRGWVYFTADLIGIFDAGDGQKTGEYLGTLAARQVFPDDIELQALDERLSSLVDDEGQPDRHVDDELPLSRWDEEPYS
jgi:hypothetical protein